MSIYANKNIIFDDRMETGGLVIQSSPYLNFRTATPGLFASPPALGQLGLFSFKDSFYCIISHKS